LEREKGTTHCDKAALNKTSKTKSSICQDQPTAGALWQIRISILYLQRMKRHKHAKFLETIVHHIQISKDNIHLYKFEARAGIPLE
jgi:hypothetical protein